MVSRYPALFVFVHPACSLSRVMNAAGCPAGALTESRAGCGSPGAAPRTLHTMYILDVAVETEGMHISAFGILLK